MSRQTLDCATGIIRQYRKQIGSPQRERHPCWQALLVPACLRRDETIAELAAGFGISTAA